MVKKFEILLTFAVTLVIMRRIQFTLLVVGSMLFVVNISLIMVLRSQHLPALQLSMRASLFLYQLAKPSWSCSLARSVEDGGTFIVDRLLKIRTTSSRLELPI